MPDSSILINPWMFRNFLRAVLKMTQVSAEGFPKILKNLATKRHEPSISESSEEPAFKKSKKRIQNRKYAMFLAYQGENYFGMQVFLSSINF